MVTTINVDDEEDRWKWVCPNGHRTWEPTNNHFWCQHCAARHGVDGEFDQLRNKATDELLERDEIELRTAVGVYEA